MSFHVGACLNVVWISALIYFSVGLFLAMPCKNVFKEKIITKHNIQKTHIHSFHNGLLGEVTVILELFLKFSYSIRIVVEPTLYCVPKLHLLKILVWKQVRNNTGSELRRFLKNKTKQTKKKKQKKKTNKNHSKTKLDEKNLSFHDVLDQFVFPYFATACQAAFALDSKRW